VAVRRRDDAALQYLELGAPTDELAIPNRKANDLLWNR
jgi:hypothetical protein